MPAERRLEFDVREGWGPVCKFLGCGIPDMEFPRENSAESFRGKIRAVVLRGLGEGVWEIGRWGVCVVGCLWVGGRVWERLKDFEGGLGWCF